MGNLFDLDAPIWAWMTEVADIMILSVLWWFCSVPIITSGASTTALFYVIGKKVRKEQTYVVKDFFKSFKGNFKQTIPLTILMVVAFCSAGLYAFMVIQNILAQDPEGMLKIVLPITILFVFEVVNLFTYLWAILSRFDMKSKQLIKTTFIMTHKHLLTTILITAMYSVGVYLIFKIPALFLLAPGVIVFGASFFVQPIFSRYIETSKLAEEVQNEEDLVEVIEEEVTAE